MERRRDWQPALIVALLCVAVPHGIARKKPAAKVMEAPVIHHEARSRSTKANPAIHREVETKAKNGG